VTVVPTGASGLLESHKLVPNFTRNQVEDFHQSAVELQRRGTYKAQADTMIDMKKAMNFRETFTEFYRELNSNSGVDVDVDGVRGKLGVRVNRNSALVRMWEMLGGDFTESETKHLNAAATAGEPPEIIVDEETIDLIRFDRFDEAESVAQDIFDQGVSSMDGTDIANHPAVKASMFETLAEQAHPLLWGSDFSVRFWVARFRTSSILRGLWVGMTVSGSMNIPLCRVVWEQVSQSWVCLGWLEQLWGWR